MGTGGIAYVLNYDPDSIAAQFVEVHGPCPPSLRWCVVDLQMALAHAVAQGVQEYPGEGKVLGMPAVMGIGGSLLHFVDQCHHTSPYNREYDWIAQSKPQEVLSSYDDHLAHNASRAT